MHSKIIRKTTKDINSHLHDLDRVMNGILYTMSYFNFEHHFEILIDEISKKENLTSQNKSILGNYYSMCELLDYSYERWDSNNYETHPDYNEINAMYVAIHNTCNSKILQFLKTYDAENIEVICYDDDEPVSIWPLIDEIENAKNTDTLFDRLVNSINVRPGAFGLSIDLKQLFKK